MTCFVKIRRMFTKVTITYLYTIAICIGINVFSDLFIIVIVVCIIGTISYLDAFTYIYTLYMTICI